MQDLSINNQHKLKNSMVAIYLPVFNSEDVIEDTLKSFINQTHKKLKIFILDNKSTDNTVQIINKIKKRDNRITLVIDKKRRSAQAAQIFLYKKYISKFKFGLQASDDDIYHKKYIELNLQNMKNNNSSLSYSSFNLLSMSGKKIFTKEKSIYQNSKNTIFNSYFVNTIKYIIYRNPVPIVFGVFKTKNFSQSMLKFNKIYDESRANYENLYMIDFLINNKISYLNKKLFYYRERDRFALAEARGQKNMNFGLKFYDSLKILKYQFIFSKKVFSIILKARKINYIHKYLIFNLILMTYFQKSFSFLVRSFLKRINNYF
jgi:glycosyltransferase involved in cell wall biosynthesis